MTRHDDFSNFFFHSWITLIALKVSWKQSHCVQIYNPVQKIFSFLDIFVFFSPPPHFNVVTPAKSTGKSCILNIEKGEGEIDRIQCNFIENEE